MSAARVVHFGDDGCHRLDVIRQAGYDASVCRSKPELVQHLQGGGLDAVLFSGIPEKGLRVQELRSQANIPFVVFAAPIDVAQPASFDLVVDPATTPGIWLERLARTIQTFRKLREKAILIRGRSAALRHEVEDVVREAAAARARWHQMQSRFALPAEFRSAFTDLMLDAQRVADALDCVTKRDGSKATAAAIDHGKRAHARLMEYQRTALMTRPEANALQYALDLLRARLKFFGEGV